MHLMGLCRGERARLEEQVTLLERGHYIGKLLGYAVEGLQPSLPTCHLPIECHTKLEECHVPRLYP